MSKLAVPLEELEDCFQGVLPSPVCSVSADGIPNITSLSIVDRVDESHVALSRQFFNKTLANILANPRLQVFVVDPVSGRQFRLDLTYERTESEGALFDRVHTRLDAVASQSGMSKVFKLAAVDVCRVVACAELPGEQPFASASRGEVPVSALEDFSSRLSVVSEVDDLITASLDAFSELFGYEHAIFLLVGETRDRLYAVGSRGYASAGAGAEVGFGDGIIGVAAARRRSIRVANLQRDRAYSRAVRSSFEGRGGAEQLEKEIPLPGLAGAFSQLAVPVLARDELLGLLCLQSETPGRFGAADESILNVIASQIGLTMALLQAGRPQPTVTAQTSVDATEEVAQVKYYVADDSIFIDNEYLIKGVAGRVLWRLLRSYMEERRVDFTNKEIRLDSGLELPDIKDNLEARLILLRRRLDDRCDFLRISNTGRGRFRLTVRRELVLRQIEG